MRSIRVQECHEQVFDIATSFICLNEVGVLLGVRLLYVNWIGEEGCWRPALEGGLHELDGLTCGLEHAVGQPAFFSFEESGADGVVEYELLNLVVLVHVFLTLLLFLIKFLDELFGELRAILVAIFIMLIFLLLFLIDRLINVVAEIGEVRSHKGSSVNLAIRKIRVIIIVAILILRIFIFVARKTFVTTSSFLTESSGALLIS